VAPVRSYYLTLYRHYFCYLISYIINHISKKHTEKTHKIRKKDVENGTHIEPYLRWDVIHSVPPGCTSRSGTLYRRITSAI